MAVANDFLYRWALNTAGLLVVAYVLAGIDVAGVVPAVVAGLLLGLANAIIRPIALFLTFPINLVTLGLFTLVINGFMLWLVAAAVEGFDVRGFGAAVLGALLLSIISAVLTTTIGGPRRRRR